MKIPLRPSAWVSALLLGLACHVMAADSYLANPEFRAQADKVCAMINGVTAKEKCVSASLRVDNLGQKHKSTSETIHIFYLAGAEVNQKGILCFSGSSKSILTNDDDRGHNATNFGIASTTTVPVNQIVDVQIRPSRELGIFRHAGSFSEYAEIYYKVDIQSPALRWNAGGRKGKGNGVLPFPDKASAQRFADALNKLITLTKVK